MEPRLKTGRASPAGLGRTGKIANIRKIIRQIFRVLFSVLWSVLCPVTRNYGYDTLAMPFLSFIRPRNDL